MEGTNLMEGDVVGQCVVYREQEGRRIGPGVVEDEVTGGEVEREGSCGG